MNIKYVMTGLMMVAACATASPARAANILVNGSFESGLNPGAFTTLGAGSTNITGWSITAGSVDYIGTYWQAADGLRSVDLHGTSPGTLSQSFATTVGQLYEVRFALAGNPDGAPAVKTVTVQAGGVTQSFAFDVTGKSRSNMGWVYESFIFSALNVSSTLNFVSTSSGVFHGAALDDVSVQAVPEPASLALFSGALSAIWLRRRRAA